MVLVEHNLDVLRFADQVIELGPGRKFGGKLVGQGTPEKLAEMNTLTGGFLKPLLDEYSNDDCSSFGEVKKPSAINGFQSERGERDLVVRGASKNNLRHVDAEIPKHKFTVITGVSGSGKTSLAFDTIFAEGQARYVESLSTGARRFLGRMDKALVIALMDWHQQLRSIRKHRVAIRGQLWQPPQRFLTICVFCTQELV